MRFLTVSVVFMGKPGQTNIEFTFQKSQPISRVAAPRNRWQGCLRACEAPHVLADVSPCAACLCASVGTWLRQPQGGERRGAQLQRQMLTCPCALARAKWDILLSCTDSTGKPNMSWLLAACRERNYSFSSSVSIAMVLFRGSCSN